MKLTLYSQLDRLATDRWAWLSLRTLLRACWLGACVSCIWLGGSLVWGWPVQLEWLAAAALGCVGGALLTRLRPRMRPGEAARRLDRRFGLSEQLATALEVAAADPPPGSVGAQLVLQATRTSRGLRQRLRLRQRLPWIELLTLLAVALAVVGLLLLSGIGAPWLGGLAAPLPPLPRVADPAELFEDEPPPEAQGEGVPGEGGELAPGEGEQTGPGQQSAAGEPQAGTPGEPQAGGGDPRTMQELADALRDQGATRPAADALDRGDAGQAAQELRELADQAGQLSDASRGDLADNLRDAARNIERTDPQMADQLRDSASGLESSGSQPSRALDELAEALDQMAGGQGRQGDQLGPGQPGAGEQGEGQGGDGGQGAEQGGQGEGQGGGAGNAASGQQRPVQPERLGVDGRPVELTAEGGGQSSAEPGEPGTTVPGGTGATTGGNPKNVGAVGPDPLRIPLDERDVVQEYFNP
jgi:hypothetical protein